MNPKWENPFPQTKEKIEFHKVISSVQLDVENFTEFNGRIRLFFKSDQ